MAPPWSLVKVQIRICVTKRTRLSGPAVLIAPPASSRQPTDSGTSASTAGCETPPRAVIVVGQVLPLRRRFTRS